MRYLLVDRITDWHREGAIAGVKNVAMSEDFLEEHFSGHPVMPGSLLLEAMVQLAGWRTALSSGFQEWALLGRVRRAAFYGFVLPGDQVTLGLTRADAGGAWPASYSGAGHVDGRRKLAVSFEVERIPLSRIGRREDFMHLFKILSRAASASDD